MNLGLKLGKKAPLVLLSSVLFAGLYIPQSTSVVDAKAANLTPTYEVKFMLDDDILNSDLTIQSEVQNAFDLPAKAQKIAVEYFDTSDKQLDSEGWNVRFRKKEDKDNFEMTYKKRYSIANGDINAALTLANQQGFDASDTNYEAEVDWGYSKQTLSLSNDKKSKATTSGATLPTDSKALSLLVDNLPGKLKKWKDGSSWGEKQLKASRSYGPVMASKYEGSWNGIDVDVEIWPIRNASGTGTEPVIEISFKTDDYNTAATDRQQLMNYLNQEGWLVPQDSLKTQLVLDRY
ncbi:hypothetical protein PQ456_06960 [Paenibacillus kyungheensis]|uniref:CYTH domain-containing protein n=1 Tax=Paenibacillus kyungheensis TaxID=1452732 RepID=A0AAX3M5Y1_9BACL|nr:hypothetical protein [Paenibacillus kyungheensis]WCT57243.1 hypothetical protein PQ456_06960 [Paenibacillus kyungheensis]